ncbi:MAG: NAD(P)-dependent oxidoreductase [Candidatus Liptonbacteria bacterium]|nr:NAD(P)-dependent oxidoreductase [Candidatus Liptonbacteria bacterium]
MKVAVLNKISEERLLKILPGAQIVGIGDAPDVIFVRSAKVSEADLSDSLAAICRAGAGVNNIPVGLCSKRGIVVFNAPGANANAVKELVVWALISASRNTARAIRHSDEWTKGQGIEKIKAAYAGVELAGKAIFIVGMGVIGRLVAKACHDLGMAIHAYDPYAPAESFIGAARVVSLEKLPACDYVSLHAVFTKETEGICNTAFFEKLRGGVHLLNFARGELVDSSALREGLRTGKIATYTSDFYDRAIAEEFPEEAVFLPHLGASTREAEGKSLEMVVHQFARFWSHGAIENSVNFPACSPESPSGDLRIVVSNVNIPGMLAKITEAISSAGCNICYLMDKSTKGNEFGYNVIDIDDARGVAKVAELISHIPGVTKVRVIKT